MTKQSLFRLRISLTKQFVLLSTKLIKKLFKKSKKISLINFTFALLAINNNLKESINIVVVIVVKQNNNEQSFFFSFSLFTLLKNLYTILSTKKDVRQLLSAINNIKLVELIEQQLKTIQVCYKVLAI